MNKKKYIIAISFGILLGILAITTKQNVLLVLNTPVVYFLKLLTSLSLSSFMGNLIAWVLILLVSFTPVLIIAKHRPKPYQITLYSVIGLFLMGSILVYFQPNYSMIPRKMQAIAIGMLFASVILGLIYEIYIRNSNQPQNVLSALVIILMIILSITIPISIKELNFSSLVSIVSITIEMVLMTHLLHLLHHVDEYLEVSNQDMLQEEALDKLQIISKYANHMLSYTIYATIFLNAFKFFLIEDSVEFNFSIPFTEMIVTSIIALFIHLMIQALSVKEENNQFI